MSFLTVAPPANNGLPRDVSEILLLDDVDVLIPVPQVVPAGTYSFAITISAQPRQDIINPASGVYTATLGGVGFSLPLAGGIEYVSLPVTPGGSIRLVHQLNYANVDMRGVIDTLFGSDTAVTVPSLASVTSMDLVVPRIASISPVGGWVPQAASNVCINPVNAIRAVIATVTQTAFLVDNSALATTGETNVSFARPNSYRIVAGYYTVSFTVDLNGYGGVVTLSIGNTLVFAADAGNVIYSWSPATITFDSDTDVIPVKLEGGVGTVIAAITAASRTVSTGNLDSSVYATLTYPDNRYFRALQATQNPSLGKIKKVRLAIEWFGNGIITSGTCQVKWADRVLGYLAAQSVGGGSLNRTITVDITSQGAAALPVQSISTVISGGTAGLSHASVAQQASITVPILKDVGAGIYRGYAPCPSFVGWSAALGDIVFKFMITATSASDAENKWFTAAVGAEFLNASGTAVSSGISASPTEAVVPGALYAVVRTLNWAPSTLRFITWGYTGTTFQMHSVAVAWNGKITEAAATVFNTPANGYSNPIAAQSLNNSGITLNTTGGNITFTIPEAPRTTVTEFDLPDITEWDQMTGKTVEVELLSTSPSVQLVQVQLAVDYDKVTYEIPTELSASVLGLSGNPADVISYLSGKLGETLETTSLRSLRAWAVSQDYMYARYISSPTDALTLRTYALSLCNAFLASTSKGLKVIRYLDLSALITDIAEADLLAPAVMSWNSRVETQITLRYAEDYTGNKGFLKTLEINSSNNKYCYRGKIANKIDTPIIVEAGFIRDDAVASYYLAEYGRLYGQSSRSLALLLPHTYAAIEEGDLIRYSTLLYRVLSVARKDSELSLSCSEVPPL